MQWVSQWPTASPRPLAAAMYQQHRILALAPGHQLGHQLHRANAHDLHPTNAQRLIHRRRTAQHPPLAGSTVRGTVLATNCVTQDRRSIAIRPSIAVSGRWWDPPGVYGPYTRRAACPLRTANSLSQKGAVSSTRWPWPQIGTIVLACCLAPVSLRWGAGGPWHWR